MGYRLPAPTSIVLGPPGCGKTTELLRQVEVLLQQGVEPDRIGYYAFTRRAATEAQDRARERFGLRRADLPHFRTLHSEAMRLMGLSSGQVLDGPRLAEFGDWIGERVTGRFSMEEGLMSGYEQGDRMLFMSNLARVRQRTLRQQYEEDHDELDWAAVERFDRGLREFKAARELVDYTDMLELFVQAGPSLELHTVFIDESPDLSPLQWAVAARLCARAHQVVVAGDDDQAIYKWAGADVDTLLELEGDVRVLGQSFRVPRSVQRVADSIISRVSRRRPKSWLPREDEGRVRHLTSLQQVDWSDRGDGDSGVMVLARNQYLLIPVLRELRSAGYLFEYHDRPSVRQEILTAVVTWERLRSGEPQRVGDVRRAYKFLEVGRGVKRGHKTLPRGGDTDSMITWDECVERGGLTAPRSIWHEAMTAIPEEERAYMVRCRRRGERFSRPPRIRVGTIHDSKGGERSRVLLMCDMAPRTHAEMQRDMDSEHRVFYVGATRAKQELSILQPQSSKSYEI